jgi:hypothetical protein
MKTYECWSSIILDRVTGWRQEPAALPTGKDPPCSLDRRLREEIEERREETELEENIVKEKEKIRRG